MQISGFLNGVVAALSIGLPILNIPLSILLATKLVGVGLGRRYWPVVGIVVGESLEALLRFRYYQIEWQILFYQLGHGLKWILALFLLWQFTEAIFSKYPSLEAFGRRAMKYLVPLCVLLGSLSFLVDNPPDTKHTFYYFSLSLNRGIAAAVVAYMLVLASFAGWFPVRMTRNIARLLIGFMVVFLTIGIGSYISHLEPDFTPWSNALASLTWTTAMTYWLVTLGRAGEEEVLSPMAAWNPERLAQTTQQLNYIQAQLAKQGNP
jgi:hypothetical protein